MPPANQILVKYLPVLLDYKTKYGVQEPIHSKKQINLAHCLENKIWKIFSPAYILHFKIC